MAEFFKNGYPNIELISYIKDRMDYDKKYIPNIELKLMDTFEKSYYVFELYCYILERLHPDEVIKFQNRLNYLINKDKNFFSYSQKCIEESLIFISYLYLKTGIINLKLKKDILKTVDIYFSSSST